LADDFKFIPLGLLEPPAAVLPFVWFLRCLLFHEPCRDIAKNEPPLIALTPDCHKPPIGPLDAAYDWNLQIQ
jgi:hypothetical protein